MGWANDWAAIRACPSSSAHEKSSRVLMLVEYAARRSVTLISSVMPVRAWRKISSRRASPGCRRPVVMRAAPGRHALPVGTPSSVREHAVDEHVAHPLGESVRVVEGGHRPEPVEVEHGEVRVGAHARDPPVVQAGPRGRQAGQAPDRLLEA